MAVWTLLRSLVSATREDVGNTDAQKKSERGATLAEYGLIVSLVVTVSIGAVGALTDGSGSYLEATGGDIGTPRLENELIPNELPPEPDWLPQPPGDGPGTPGDPGVPGNPGEIQVLNAALFNTASGSCFVSETPDTDGSEIIGAACNNTVEQILIGTGPAATSVILQFEAEVPENLCLSAVGGVGNPVVQNVCDSSAEQRWQVETNTAIVIRNFGDPTLCLTDTAGRLTVETCDFGPAQQFQ